MAREMSMDEIRSRLAGLQLYAIFVRPTERYDTQSEEDRDLMRQHLQFQMNIEETGILLAAGPLNGAGQASTMAAYRELVPVEDAPIIDASGMYIVAVPSREAADEIARSEPFEAHGWRTHVTCSWQLNEGTAISTAKAMLAALPAAASD
jgi:hypothetical protein